MEKLCEHCEKRDHCKTPCKAVKKILWEDNRVMERHFKDHIVCYPQNREVHFSELQEHQREHLSDDDVVPWSSGDLRLRKSRVFVERFFNKVPCKELAEMFGVKENTIVCMYAQAEKQVQRIIEALDARREGLKATKGDKFSEDQKFFLLVSVFGFSGAEVARMFNKDRNRVNMIVKRMADKYQAFFAGETDTEGLPVDDPPMPGKLSRGDLVKMVEAYTEQGFSHRQAFQRIAQRQTETVGRPVKTRAVQSRYYKAQRSSQVNG